MKFDPWVGKIPWRRKWQPTPVFLPGKFHGQMSLTGYTLKGHKELDMTEQLSTHNERISNVLPNILVAMVLIFFFLTLQTDILVEVCTRIQLPQGCYNSPKI